MHTQKVESRSLTVADKAVVMRGHNTTEGRNHGRVGGCRELPDPKTAVNASLVQLLLLAAARPLPPSSAGLAGLRTPL